jgi:hypothetical protein
MSFMMLPPWTKMEIERPSEFSHCTSMQAQLAAGSLVSNRWQSMRSAGQAIRPDVVVFFERDVNDDYVLHAQEERVGFNVRGSLGYNSEAH